MNNADWHRLLEICSSCSKTTFIRRSLICSINVDFVSADRRDAGNAMLALPRCGLLNWIKHCDAHDAKHRGGARGGCERVPNFDPGGVLADIPSRYFS
jgi:hypothetical protein